MSTSLLYHAFGIRGYQLTKTEFQKDAIYFHINQDKFNLRCPDCKSSKVIRRGKRIRSFRSLPIGGTPTTLVLPHQRVGCKECGSIKYVNIPFAEPKKKHTRAFKRYAISLLRFSTIQDVAKHLQVGWDMIKDIDKSDLKKFQKPDLSDVEQIAIDEICIGKGHQYLTVVIDVISGAVLHVGEGKGGDSLIPFWKKLQRARVSIKAVATDMSSAYTSAVRKNIPNAMHVVDRFHVVKLYNEKLSDLRRKLYNEVENTLKKRP